jgi:hypothetical protein
MRWLSGRPSLVGAVALAASCGWVLATNWDPIVHGHPSYLALYFGLLAAGAALAVTGSVRGRSPRRGWSLAASVGLLFLTGAALWLSPFAADDSALAALERPPDSVRVVESWTSILIEPESSQPAVGVVFHPGARVDARAYARILLPLAYSGFQVVIVKEPLGIAFLSSGFLGSWAEVNPEVGRWVVGGHSLGGVAASTQAVAESTDGLMLWASYPAEDISDEASLEVASLYGTNDGLSVPERVEASASDLPASAQLLAVEGAIHAYFGDYGSQPGDGEPAVDRETAQRQIVEASRDFLEDLSVGR